MPSPPKPKTATRNPIDAFVRHRLAANGLAPSPSASRRELIRRLTYDLIGLPPSPEEVAAFVADPSPRAHENLVDRLLASPHYGEKQARWWLDLVRYAETNSYERDNPKPHVWKYRDYVIRSFNQDKPYDRFIREQLAGDEMEDAPGDAILATSYYRLGIWDDEPADMQQAVYDDLDDIIATTSQAFLGMTLDCARCHDHKLDPVSQKDYYRFLAFFHNINRFRNGGPTDEAPYFATPAARLEFERKTARIAEGRKAFQTEIDLIERDLRTQGIGFGKSEDLSDLAYRYFERDWKRVPELGAEPVLASGKLDSSLVTLRPRKRNDAFALEFSGKINVPADGEYRFRLAAEGGYRLILAGERLVESQPEGNSQEKEVAKSLKAGRHDFQLVFTQRNGQHGLVLSWSGPGFSDRPLSALESCGEGTLKTLLGPALEAKIDASLLERMAGLISRQAKLEKRTPTAEMVLCVSEKGSKVPETRVLLRGVPTALGEKVEPGFPEAVSSGIRPAITPPSGGRSTGGRTALADWIASPANPLTARVIVNRVWQSLFGRGIVRTPNDFGLAGLPPTHPELLDWLASEFISQGWSIKRLQRLIVTSQTYRQSSRPNRANLAKDPQNDLFWRFDMRRLTAEEIRDSLLAVSGSLNLAMFGPSVYPEIPKEILAAQSIPGKDWHTGRMTATDVTRRSIYVSVKRSLIYPVFANFDFPETDRPNPGRFASTQPTQALGMLNGPLFNHQAGVLAERIYREAGSEPTTFCRRLLAVVLQRPPTSRETADALSLYQKLSARGAKAEVVRKYVSLMALNLNEFLYID